VSLLELTFVCLCQLLFFHRIRVLMQDVGYACSALWGVTLPDDAVRREANRANNEQQWAQRQRRQVRSASRAAERARGEETPSELESSGDVVEEEGEDEEEGEVTPSPHSPPPEDLPSLGNLFSQQAGISVGTHQPKHP
jgi:hypothetical protein